MSDTELIETVVREVIRRLTASGIAVASTAVAQSDRELVLKDRLITLATLKGRLSDVSRVTVLRRAVVTPAAKDELKKRSIQLNSEN